MRRESFLLVRSEKAGSIPRRTHIVASMYYECLQYLEWQGNTEWTSVNITSTIYVPEIRSRMYCSY